AALSGADANHFFHRGDEDLAVSDAPGASALHDGIDGITRTVVGHQDRHLHLGEEIDHVLGPTVELGVPFLTAEPLHLAHRHPLHADGLEALLHFIELEWLDDGIDPLHCILLVARRSPRICRCEPAETTRGPSPRVPIQWAGAT